MASNNSKNNVKHKVLGYSITFSRTRNKWIVKDGSRKVAEGNFKQCKAYCKSRASKKVKKKTTKEKTVNRSLPLTNCMDCPFHLVRRDPDPNDWFCDDDEKVVCTNTKVVNNNGDGKVITSACRPYNKRRECEIPNWCPLPKK